MTVLRFYPQVYSMRYMYNDLSEIIHHSDYTQINAPDIEMHSIFRFKPTTFIAFNEFNMSNTNFLKLFYYLEVVNIHVLLNTSIYFFRQLDIPRILCNTKS